MRVGVRVDSSLQIGTGHVVRCLALAEQLRALGAEVEFFSRDYPGNISSVIRAKGFVTHLLSSEPPLSGDAEMISGSLVTGHGGFSAMVVDHYGLEAAWEKSVKTKVGRIAVIDDLADRRHDCELLLDQNLYPSPEQRYEHLVPPGCKLLLGPTYVLLRDEFQRQREHLKSRSGALQRILVFFGGTDPTGETLKALSALELLEVQGGLKLEVQVIAGVSNPFRGEIAKWISTRKNYRLGVQVDNMAELLAESDLAIGAGGGTVWERFCLGVSSIVVAVAENQVAASKRLGEQGFHRYLGRHSEVSVEKLSSAIEECLADPAGTRAFGRKALGLVDGQGARRAAMAVLQLVSAK